ncbi:MAG: hypothetical protein ACP5QU_03545 [Anaerolineae bacterium]
MPNLSLIAIHFCDGLAFFSMGLMVAMEGGRSTDKRLRMALRPLAGFGIVHAAHEWLEMFELISLTGIHSPATLLTAAELCLLASSFLSLAAFGSYPILGGETTWRVSLLLPLAMETIWVFSRYAGHHQRLDTLRPGDALGAACRGRADRSAARLSSRSRAKTGRMRNRSHHGIF